MQFLQWKRERYLDCFNKNDRSVIETGQVDQFAELSEKALAYTKVQIHKYTEIQWKPNSIDNQIQIEGLIDSPKVSTSKLKFPHSTNESLKQCS